MIELDFKFESDVSGPEGPYPDLWVDEIQCGAFEGFQTFIVNNVDLSGPLPILGFARSLRVIAMKLANIRIGEAQYQDLSSLWILRFRATGNDVEISDRRGSALIPSNEFLEAAQAYANRVYKKCSEICPAILENEFVVAWWTDDDFFDKPFEPQQTDRTTLTPRHPFYRDPK